MMLSAISSSKEWQCSTPPDLLLGMYLLHSMKVYVVGFDIVLSSFGLLHTASDHTTLPAAGESMHHHILCPVWLEAWGLEVAQSYCSKNFQVAVAQKWSRTG